MPDVLLVLVLLMVFWFPIASVSADGGYEGCPSSRMTLPLCEHGRLVHWQAFVTANGTLGGEGYPQCVTATIDGTELKTESVRVKVGQLGGRASQNAWEGGGLTQTLNGDGRQVSIGAQVAVEYFSRSDRRNLAGGLFELLVNDVVIAREEVGPIETGTFQSMYIQGRTTLPKDAYILSIRIRRPFLSTPDTPAPYQYVRRVEIVGSATSHCRKDAQ
ncbi:MAG: hypothetical protein D6690_12140 [Nitrospirae bacterium]|nr:MAG: hypothetical protein D6690_12140 [Nitrospirota bacterium]